MLWYSVNNMTIWTQIARKFNLVFFSLQMVTLSCVYRCSVQIFIHFMLDIEYIIKGVLQRYCSLCYWHSFSLMIIFYFTFLPHDLNCHGFFSSKAIVVMLSLCRPTKSLWIRDHDDALLNNITILIFNNKTYIYS